MIDFNNRFLNNFKVGISIAKSQDLHKLGFDSMHLSDITIEIARYLLSCGAIIVYGGYIKHADPNFVNVLSDVIKYYKENYEKTNNRLINYVAYPLYNNIDEDDEADLEQYIQFIRVRPEEHKEKFYIDMKVSPTEHNIHEKFINAVSLSFMRETMNKGTQANIMLGGKTKGYSGKYPGLVEEAYLALTAKKPVYLIGAYGGCANVIIQALKGQPPLELTTEEQCKDENYNILYEYYNKKSNTSLELINYERIGTFFKETGIKGLNNGLDDNENNLLFESIDTAEIISLILKGLKNVKTTFNNS
ncbi:MAG: hypothetical protein L3V56_05820 [Candidatus Magnetoovum sp. WYHC-5]|nr:hypothetical protein [Candidatus Magnetoovum sp. WYHC-5]